VRGLQGKRIVLAGGAAGIGDATAEGLAVDDAAITVGDINFPAAQDTVSRVTAAGGTAAAVEFDLADEKCGHRDQSA
jgi:NAD(P)-dependent dehydrogenase (short-subunit alcohol dehydrogenase family)